MQFKCMSVKTHIRIGLCMSPRRCLSHMQCHSLQVFLHTWGHYDLMYVPPSSVLYLRNKKTWILTSGNQSCPKFEGISPKCSSDIVFSLAIWTDSLKTYCMLMLKLSVKCTGKIFVSQNIWCTTSHFLFCKNIPSCSTSHTVWLKHY